MIKLKKVNDVVVKPIKTKTGDTRPVKGAAVCPWCYSNIALIAPTAGGKTTTLGTIIDQCAGKKTKIIAFVSTLYNDETYAAIIQRCKEKKIEFVGHDSLFEDGKDLLSEYLEQFKEEAKERERKEAKAHAIISLEDSVADKYLFFDEEDEKKEKKEKCQYPEIIMIFDDLANEIRSKAYEALLKKARHYHIMTITCTQDLKDISPASKAQIRIWLLFKNLNPERLQNVYDAISCRVSFEKFKAMYDYATEGYNFLYINVRQGEYRKNFNMVFPV